MGEKLNGGNEENHSTGSSTSTSTSASTTGTENGGRRRGRPSTSGKSDQKVPKVVSIDLPGNEEPPKEKPKTGRGRPAGTKKKPTAAKKADHTQISMLLLTVSGIMASRQGMEPFALTMEEANQIAIPLSSIMAKNEAVAGIAGEYADHIALLFACMTIFIPKYLVYRAMNPKTEKKGEKKTNVQPIREPNEKGQVTRSDKPVTGRAANSGNGQTFNGDLSSILPAIAGI